MDNLDGGVINAECLPTLCTLQLHDQRGEQMPISAFVAETRSCIVDPYRVQSLATLGADQAPIVPVEALLEVDMAAGIMLDDITLLDDRAGALGISTGASGRERYNWGRPLSRERGPSP